MSLSLPFLRTRTLVALLLGLALLLAGCGGDDDGGGGDAAAGEESTETTEAAEEATETTEAAAEVSGTVTVFAAASLTESFEDLAEGFTAEYPDVEVQYNFAGSQALASQIEEGAPADVFASANTTQMDRVAEGDLIAGEPQVFVSNLLQIVVPAGNPNGITGLEDLAKPDLLVVLAAEEVPVGGYSLEALGNAGVEVEPVSLESDVKQVVTKVALGEADAGIVYATDVTAEGDAVEGVDIPDEFNVPATYPIAVTAESANPEAAQAFVDYVLSDDGQATLQEFGFLSPES